MLIPLIIIFYYQKVGFASATVAKQVDCEWCGSEYVYAMSRGITVTSTIMNQSQCEVRAHQRLERALAHDIEPAPCPSCGRYQRDMLRRIRWSRTWLVITIALTICVPFIVAIELLSYLNHAHGIWYLIPPIALSLCTGAILWAVTINDNAESKILNRQKHPPRHVMLLHEYLERRELERERREDKTGRWNDSLSSYLSHVKK